MSRDDAYRVVQAAARRAIDERRNFRDVIESDDEVKLSDDALATAFDPDRLLAHRGASSRRWSGVVSDLGLTRSTAARSATSTSVDDDHLLMVASDRLSAFDVVMNEPIPDKGRVLTGITNFWVNEFGASRAVRPRELRPRGDRTVRAGISRHTAVARSSDARAQRRDVAARVHRAWAPRRSGLRRVRARGTVHEMTVPPGLETDRRLRRADVHAVDQGGRRATTSTSASSDAALLVGAERGRITPRRCASDLFTRAADALAAKGLILADTKFELGFVDGELVAVRRGGHARLVADLAGRPGPSG